MKYTAYLDGGFFITHTDEADSENPVRTLSYIFYIHKTPKRFHGGPLLLFDYRKKDKPAAWNSFTRIIPSSNSLVIFPSDYYYAVAPVFLSDNQFSNGRITISGHIRNQ